MLPADQRLKAGELPAVERDDRLIMHSQLLALECSTQVILHLQQIDRVCVHAFVKNLVARLALSFRSVHCGVGVTQHVLGMMVTRGTERDADAGGGKNFMAAEVEGRLEFVLLSLLHPWSFVLIGSAIL